jgi:uncharacterized membrane protein YhaH (DUF805 family)
MTNVARPSTASVPVRVLTLTGRINRLRYLSWTFAVGVIPTSLLWAIKDELLQWSIAAAVPYALPFIVINCILARRRLQDFGWEWWALPARLIPFVSLAFELMLLMRPGHKQPNEHGPVPPPATRGELALFGLSLAVILMLSFSIGQTLGEQLLAQRL